MKPPKHITYIKEYLKNVTDLFQSGKATEHSYRPAFKNLIENLIKDITITNEPKQQKCGAPDFLVQNKNKVPTAYIEAKDLKNNLLDGLEKGDNNNQLLRYVSRLDNVMTTNYIEFRFYQKTDDNKIKKLETIQIATITNNKIKPINDNFAPFINLLKNFCAYNGTTINTAEKLASLMALKAQTLKDAIYKALTCGDDCKNTNLYEQFTSFQKILIKDLDEASFADIYSQTITYGLFAARLHDKTPQSFSRYEAMELMPRTNPFLRHLFEYVGGANLDTEIIWIVDALVDIFRHANLSNILQDFGKKTATQDPMIHFYETFLHNYNPQLKKSRGVYYTPEPVVKFIIKACDDVLKKDFKISDGICDTSMVNIKFDDPKTQTKTTKQVHKVQILDPACGTGTFLCEVIKYIADIIKTTNSGGWHKYVDEDLIPRLNGFELLLAPYAMCHLKLQMLLKTTGYQKDDKNNNRFNVFLTNSLEPEHEYAGLSLFGAKWLSDESRAADRVKKDTPVMIVLGNPPYAGESSNKGKWIENLLDDYKKEPTGGKLQEKNSKWLNDDYVKFIKYSQNLIEKNGEGILAFINPHGFLDNPTFRGMRHNLLKTYDKIYIIDLHGNSKKKEVCPDGTKDQNVFDIMQGVSINIFIKKKRHGLARGHVPLSAKNKNLSNKLAKVFHFDLYGKRQAKYGFLLENDLTSIQFEKLKPQEPYYFFKPKDYQAQAEYDKGFVLTDLFPINSVGIVTARDNFTIHKTADEVKKTIQKFLKLDDEEAREHFKLGKDVRDWKISYAKKDLIKTGVDFKKITKISYRPFDNRWTYYSKKSKGFLCMPRGEVMSHFLKTENIGLVFKRGFVEKNASPCFVSANIIDFRSWSRPGMQGGDYVCPLYLYPDKESDGMFTEKSRKPNLDMKIVEKIADNLKLEFKAEKIQNYLSPIDILDYIYAVLHSPKYRKKYQEFLKIDFPRVPYPADKKTFWQCIEKGATLRKLHLMENIELTDIISPFKGDGDATVEKHTFIESKEKDGTGKVWINKNQYFDNVPSIAWNFFIGGYQPLQKWLKSRKDQDYELSNTDITHYQKIIYVLFETNKIMQQIDKIKIIEDK
ncbi:MAG: DNA methyltransferase [Gammaproteobacteria bacterium]|nr:MAG: DNA methyltransferase [Gammaproteobacteria bacterium]